MIATLVVLMCMLIIHPTHPRSLSSVRPDEDLAFFFPRVPSVTLDQIKDILTRAQDLREKSQKAGQARAVAAALAAAVGTLPPIQFSQSMPILKMLPGEVHAYLPAAVEILARIRALGVAAECRERHGGQGPPDSPRILIAANLYDCEEIMPFWILEVLRLALLLQGDPILQAIYTPQLTASFQLPELLTSAKPVQRIGISVYESGSRDRTALWLLVASALWKAAGVPNAVVLNGTFTRQENVMDPVTGKLLKQHRIQHLANLRNAALAPLYRNPGSFPYILFLNDVFFCATDLVRLTYLQADIACGIDVEVWIGGRVPKVRDALHRNPGRKMRRGLLATTSTAAHPTTATAAVDVTGLGDAATITNSTAAAPSTSALFSVRASVLDDPWVTVGGYGSEVQLLGQDHDCVGAVGCKLLGRGGRGLASEVLTGAVEVSAAVVMEANVTEPAVAVAAASDSDGGGEGGSDPAARWQAASDVMKKLHEDEAAQLEAARKRIAEAAPKPRYEFYDIWVSRDLAGHAFIKHDPIARDPRTLDLVHRGLPFAAKCCWNGAVYLNASLLSAGLRFRAGLRSEGECDASECSVLCEDYRRLGSGRVAVDPSVRVSYTPWTEDIHGPLPGGLPAKVPWATVKRSGALERLRSLWQETALDMQVECVPLKKGFDGADLDRVQLRNIAARNYTALFLQLRQQPSLPPFAACNLIMGPYGAADEGDFFDDLSYAAWGRNVITRILHKASEYVDSIQVVYGKTPAKTHGGDIGGVLGDHNIVESGEFINNAIVYFDDTAVHGMDLATSVGRRIVIGTLREGVRRAVATPCPADDRHTGRYRLMAFAGTSDRVLRSVTLLWS